MQKHHDLAIFTEGERFIAEWDNRKIHKDRLTTIVLPIFWIVWAPLTMLMTYNFIAFLQSGNFLEKPLALLFMLIWLFFGFYGTLKLPKLWMMRSTIERIEIDNNEYCHYFMNRKWLFPKKWKASSITKIEFGKRGKDSITTLSVHKPWKSDFIAYWAKSELRWNLFNHLRDHLNNINSPIVVKTV